MDATSSRRPVWALVATIVGLAVLGASCGGSSNSAPTPNGTTGGTISANVTKEKDAGPPRSGGKVTYGIGAETDGWNAASNRWSSYTAPFSIFDPLAAFDADLAVKPYLAKSFEHNADFTQWTIGLREGVTFHDNTPVDAAAVKKNLETYKNSGLTSETMSFVKEGGITTPNNLTVVVNMNKPWSTFPVLLTAQVGVVMAPTQIDADPKIANTKPIGSGPFSFQTWEPNKVLKLKKYDKYWRKGFPLLDAIDFTPIAEVQSRGAALESGAIDIMETNDPGQILKFKELADNGEYQMYTDQRAEGSKIFVGLNQAKPPFDDPIAREALAYAADTQSLSDQAYEGVFPPVRGPFNSTSPYYKQTDYPEHNLQRAKELAAEYEQKHGKPLSFTANIIPVPEIRQVAQVLKEQAAAAGIEVKIVEEEQIKLIVDALGGNYEATGFILFGSPQIDREYVFFASPAKPIGESSLNFTRIGLGSDGKPNGANDKLVAAMDAARATDDPVKQKEQYGIVQDEMAKNKNFIFLVQQTTAVVYVNNLHGVAFKQLPDDQGEMQVSTSPFTFSFWISNN